MQRAAHHRPGRAQVWDLGGQTSIRPYWRCYYPNTQAIIYVVDSSDTERIGTSAEEFHAILDEEELKDALILVYANKQARSACRQVQSPGTLRGLVSRSVAARRAPVACRQAAAWRISCCHPVLTAVGCPQEGATSAWTTTCHSSVVQHFCCRWHGCNLEA
jgi:hypothetical protein